MQLKLASAFVLGLACLLMSGCASAGERPEPAISSVPSFSGPHAALFSELYGQSSDDFSKSVLKDEKVTDQERREALERFRACLDGHGVVLGNFDDVSGGYDYTMKSGGEIRDSDDANVEGCGADSGFSVVDLIYRETRSNPENRDFSEIMVACLKQADAVAPEYSISDFEREYPEGSVALLRPELRDTREDPVVLCQNDPLGLVLGGSE